MNFIGVEVEEVARGSVYVSRDSICGGWEDGKEFFRVFEFFFLFSILVC